MAEITRNRTIRPSSRAESSRSYKIDTSNVTSNDTLIVNIDHESKPFKQFYKFSGSSVAGKNSISFRVNDFGTRIEISWSGAQPISNIQSSIIKKPFPKPEENVESKPKIKTSTHKQGLPPIADSKSKVLILGSMPGEESLSKQEYYAHPRNLFWKIIATITGSQLPESYSKKKELLLQSNIAIWDVCEVCIREGSLDSKIVDENPNDLETFLEKHPMINRIAFNGRKSSDLFDKYFIRKVDFNYFILPSSSPANAGISWGVKLAEWSKIIMYLH